MSWITSYKTPATASSCSQQRKAASLSLTVFMVFKSSLVLYNHSLSVLVTSLMVLLLLLSFLSPFKRRGVESDADAPFLPVRVRVLVLTKCKQRPSAHANDVECNSAIKVNNKQIVKCYFLFFRVSAEGHFIQFTHSQLPRTIYRWIKSHWSDGHCFHWKNMCCNLMTLTSVFYEQLQQSTE